MPHAPAPVFAPMFGINGSDYSSRAIEINSLRLYWKFIVFCLLYFQINNNIFTYDKFNSAKFRFSMMDIFSDVLFKLFTFLISATDKDICNIYQ